MIIYDALKRDFIQDVKNELLVKKVHELYREKIGDVSLNEIRSWNNSLMHMRNVVDDDQIPDNSGIAIEFNVPYTSKRVDFIVSGKNEDGNNCAVIVELKQWDHIELLEYKDGIVKTFLNGAIRETIHPSYQAYTYAKMIQDYNQSVQDEKIGLYPCAYLHNYEKTTSDPIENNVYQTYIRKAPIFTLGEGLALRKFITKHIKFGDNKETLYKIDNGRLRPSKSLQDCLASLLNGNKEFVMIDEQKVVYEKALELGRLSHIDGKKRVLIVEGGPGTGKSVLAINLLVQMIIKHKAVCAYVTKNSAPRNVYLKKLKGQYKEAVIGELFQGSGNFYNVKPNTFDAIFCDEAHRLNQKSGLFKNRGENQIKEIINASKFSVFFIDEHQRIHINDAGSISEIEKYGNFYNAEIYKTQLQSQFRCNGSDGYLAWVDNVLKIRQTANFDGFDNYDFEIVDSPTELFEKIKTKNQINNKSRIVAGYCWNWLDEGRNNPNHYDINIGDFHASWNLGNTATWAIDPDSIDQIGCIHTSQGLEFDYVGVIIGNDIGVDSNGKIYTDWHKRAKTDASIKGLKKLESEDPEKAKQIAAEIIKNTYRTLLTRGLKGCYVYCVDKAFADYLKAHLK